MSASRLAVGRGDMLRFGFGAAVPCLVLASAVVIAGFVLAGADVGSGITLAFTLAFVLAIALEMLRRYVLATGRGIGLFRALVWTVIAAALPVTALLAVGVVSGCFGRSCAALSHYMLTFMLVCCVLVLPLVPLGYGLLQKAVWLRRKQAVLFLKKRTKKLLLPVGWCTGKNPTGG